VRCLRLVLPIGNWQGRLESMLEGMALADSFEKPLDQRSTYQWMAIYEAVRAGDPSIEL
jgi:hypothetical protein